MRVEVGRSVFSANDEAARSLRDRFREAGLFVVNIMGSPGAGKTSLVERTLSQANGRLQVAVIEGDPATSLDADRVARLGAPVTQVNTGGGCHLDAAMIEGALERLDLSGVHAILIENVGNLVCPAQFDLGESARVIVSSLPEGDDKVLKYPASFCDAPLVVLNKVDLAEHLDFDCCRFRESLTCLNADALLIELSCRTGAGVDRWMSWLEEGIAEARRTGGA